MTQEHFNPWRKTKIPPSKPTHPFGPWWKDSPGFQPCEDPAVVLARREQTQPVAEQEVGAHLPVDADADQPVTPLIQPAPQTAAPATGHVRTEVTETSDGGVSIRVFFRYRGRVHHVDVVYPGSLLDAGREPTDDAAVNSTATGD